MRAELQHILLTYRNKKIERNLFAIDGTLFGQSILVAFVGVGMSNASTAMRKICSTYSIHVVIIIGVAGALAHLLKTDTLFVPSGVAYMRQDNGVIKQSLSFDVDRNLHAKICETVKGKLNYVGDGTLLTQDVPIIPNDVRHRLYTLTRALAVDMESYALFKIARLHNIPCVVMRYISDTQAHESATIKQKIVSASRLFCGIITELISH